MKVGIDCFAFDIPKIYLPIKTLAEKRNIEPEKLIKGLGLHKMSFPDVHQDVITFAANAVYKLLLQENLKPEQIDRIYVGSESGVDASKPIASYIIELLEQQFGKSTFNHCDVVDLTFACIGAVDALQVNIDFVRLNPDKKAIVVATDNAKYDLNSTGEYTQGAGAVAILISSNPRVLAFSNKVGVSSQGVFDFFKPRRYVSKKEILKTDDNLEWFGILENEIAIYKEQPVFDGQYSNQCYINRITEAYFHFKKTTNQTDIVYQNWENILMHLPYCFQARRTFVEIFAQENPIYNLKITDLDYKDRIKAISKSDAYLEFVNRTIYPSEIASGQVGNMYTGSIFLGLLSTLSYHFENKSDLTNKKMGFIAYGSGSKSKVFEAEVQKDWREGIKSLNLFETLNKSIEIDFETYLKLHKKEQKVSVLKPCNEFTLERIETKNPVLIGARYYKYVD